MNRLVSRANRTSRFGAARRTTSSLVEKLESRQLMAITLGAESVVNGGAEANTASSTGNDIITPTGWTRNGNSTIVKYGAGADFPSTASPGPSLRGANFFAGGPTNSNTDFFQTIDVSNQSANIDANKLRFALNVYLGGKTTETDNAWLFLNFQNGTGGFLSQSFVGPVTPANRSNVTGLILKSLGSSVPAQTRKVQVQIHFDSVQGSYHNGYADNVSVVFFTNGPTGTVAGTVFNDLNGNGSLDSGEGGLGGVKVFSDANNNGALDAGEINATSASNGTYTMTVPVGTVRIRQLTAPATFRLTSSNPLTFNVLGGVNYAGKNFADSQTVLISGNVFNDANNNKVKDSTETNAANVSVYLDFNNNGQWDSFELKTTSDSSGNYKFVVPFGTYVVRVIAPSGRTVTTPTSGYSITLAKGQTSTGKNFGLL